MSAEQQERAVRVVCALKRHTKPPAALAWVKGLRADELGQVLAMGRRVLAIEEEFDLLCQAVADRHVQDGSGPDF